MTDINHPHHSLFWRPRQRPAPMESSLSIHPLNHAARSLVDNPPRADIVLLESADALIPYIGAVDELAAAAMDSNPLYESAALQAAMTHLAPQGAVRVALVWSEPKADGARLLIGAFPYQVQRFYLGLPIAVWTLWTHVHSFLATPLVRKGHERAAIRRFLGFADQSGAPLVRFPLFEAGGAFDAALDDVLAQRGLASAETERHERAFLKSDLDGEAYLATHMRKKKRKEYNRLWNRLADNGEVEFATHDGGPDFHGWLEQFLRLERSGWKGKRGTALAERLEDRQFFESLSGLAYSKSKLHCVEIRMEGKPIAMLASFLSGGGAYSFKIAYDEAFAKYSPGALLMMKAIGAFQSDPGIAWVDSCAIPNHPMIDHIWAQRRGIRAVNAATVHPLSYPLVVYASRATRVADFVWAKARAIYHRIRKEVEHD